MDCGKTKEEEPSPTLEGGVGDISPSLEQLGGSTKNLALMTLKTSWGGGPRRETEDRRGSAVCGAEGEAAGSES